jgi:hypothetical protein
LGCRRPLRIYGSPPTPVETKVIPLDDLCAEFEIDPRAAQGPVVAATRREERDEKEPNEY